MRMMFLVLALTSAACGGSTAAQCRIPESFSGDAAASDCSATPTFEECQDNGDGTETCKDACHANEFSLSCDHDTQAPSSLGNCRVLPLPTPQGVTIYCCPCE
jgi:hypothetical protein